MLNINTKWVLHDHLLTHINTLDSQHFLNFFTKEKKLKRELTLHTNFHTLLKIDFTQSFTKTHKLCMIHKPFITKGYSK